MKNYILGFITAILLAYSSYMLVTPTHAVSEPTITIIEKKVGSGLSSGTITYFKLVDGNVTCYTQDSTSCVVVNR